MTTASPVTVGLADWATRTPDRTAVTDAHGSLTFAELDALAGTLARRILEHRTTDGAVVPLLLGTDRWSVVALHGALRAGVPFAPLDAGQPPAVVTGLVQRLGRSGPVVVAADADGNATAGASSTVVVPRVAADPLAPQQAAPQGRALVVFTSGSTGRAKGVVHDRATFDGIGASFATRSPVGPSERVAHLLPLHWVAGIVRALLPGLGSSILLASLTELGPAGLVERLRAEQVTVLPVTPTAATRLAAAPGRRLEAVHSVRTFGEALTWEQVGAIRGLVAPRATITTEYGATESCWSVFEHTIGPDDPLGTGPVPWGRPSAPERVRLEPVDPQPGAAREVVVCGPVSVGYLDDPDLTAARFGTDPDGTRWWRSGDLVRIDATGEVRSAGRLDEMVKIAGVLVEPAVPEAVLRSIPGVRDAAVVTARTPVGPRLVAHLVVDDAALTPGAVRAVCTARLAEYLVPSPLVRHERLPTVATGKVDRARLRDAPLHPWRLEPVRAATSDAEQWCLDEIGRIVGFTDLGPDDEPFALGLDSLGVVELCAAFADAGHPGIAPSDVLGASTVAGIAALLGLPDPPDRRDRERRMPSCVTVLNAGGGDPPLFAVPGSGSTALSFRHLAEALGPDRPLVVVEPRGLHRPGRPDRTVPALARRVVAEIEGRLAPGAPCVVMGYSAGGPVAFEAGVRAASGGHLVHLVLLDTAPTLRHVRGWSGTPGTPGTTNATDATDAVVTDRPPTPPVEVRGASVGALPGALVRSARFRGRRWRLTCFPGPPGFDAERSAIFGGILVRAGRRYRPRPTDLPVTLVRTPGTNHEAACEPTIQDLRVHTVDARHDSLLRPPAVAVVAPLLVAIVDAHAPPVMRSGSDA